ncbi:MAG TPA: CerR family C-terminal domain-containing protein [Gemmataceae bacterium]|jgi:AcrR family transcriptional regulator
MIATDLARERLMETAGQVFAEKGFQAATIREICRRAKANIAAVNYYFGDKERLYIESVKNAHGMVVSGMRELDWPEGTPAETKLADFIHAFVARLTDPDRPRWFAQLMMREMAQPTAACAELVRYNIRPVAGILMGILREILPDRWPRWKYLLVGTSIISQCVFYCQNRPIIEELAGPEDYQHFDTATLTDHITHFALAALGLRPPIGKTEVAS